MSHAALDRVLAVLVIAMAGTGLLALRAGTPGSSWVFPVHGLLGGALLAATVWKLWRSGSRAIAAGRWRRLALALAVALLVVGALTGGFLWVAGGELLTVGSLTVLTLHAWLGLLLVPVVVVHLLPHRWRVVSAAPRAGVTRRTLLASGGLALAGVAAFGVTALLDGIRGGTRRFTGSRWLPAGGIPPSTTFYGEGPPEIDVDRWRLTVGDRRLGLADLRALGEVDRIAVLDCTSGWALETTWRGVPLPAVLAIPDRGSLRISSVTGWSTVLTAEEARAALLATGVAGGPLPVANGAPCRLVIPSRRGLDWVKWVTQVEVA
jgi:Oxidoreductase molybdopterin binding domain